MDEKNIEDIFLRDMLNSTQHSKNLKEFLCILTQLTQSNIDFMEGKRSPLNNGTFKYIDELRKIQEVINGFDFVKNEYIEKGFLNDQKNTNDCC